MARLDDRGARRRRRQAAWLPAPVPGARPIGSDPAAAAIAGQVRALLAAEARQWRRAATETLDVYRPPVAAPEHVRRLDWAEHVSEGARFARTSGLVSVAARAFAHLGSRGAPAAVRRTSTAAATARRRAR
jgi:hypothetical protein